MSDWSMNAESIIRRATEAAIKATRQGPDAAERRADSLKRDATVILAGMIVADTDDNLTYADLRHRARSEAGLLHKEIDAYAEVDAEVSRKEEERDADK